METSDIKTVYDCTYFIKKFEAIPEELWIVGSEGTDSYSDRKCAYGHCGARTYLGEKQPKEAIALTSVFQDYKEKEFFFKLDWCVVKINDGCDSRYLQPTPKQRILAALYDIKSNEAVKES